VVMESVTCGPVENIAAILQTLQAAGTEVAHLTVTFQFTGPSSSRLFLVFHNSQAPYTRYDLSQNRDWPQNDLKRAWRSKSSDCMIGSSIAERHFHLWPRVFYAFSPLFPVNRDSTDRLHP